MNDPCPTTSLHCYVLKPCDQKQRLLVVLEFGFEGLSNKTAFAGDWELRFMVKHGETRKTVGYQNGTNSPSTPLLSGHFLRNFSESPFPSLHIPATSFHSGSKLSLMICVRWISLAWSRVSLAPYGGFLKCWYPTTMGFPTKNDHFGVIWGYHHLRKHPYIVDTPRGGASHPVFLVGDFEDPQAKPSLFSLFTAMGF